MFADNNTLLSIIAIIIANIANISNIADIVGIRQAVRVFLPLAFIIYRARIDAPRIDNYNVTWKNKCIERKIKRFFAGCDMITASSIKDLFENKENAKLLRSLYGQRNGSMVWQLERYTSLVNTHASLWGSERKPRLFSAPGRIELIGNHTDHNNGKVLAAAITFDTIAAVTLNDIGAARIHSEYGGNAVSLEIPVSDLAVRDSDKNNALAVLRGALAVSAERGIKLQGFDATLKSDVGGGSGLSSSAAFEVLLLLIIDKLFAESSGVAPATPGERAEMAQRVEQEYYGKPCGLMDQMASSTGGLVAIDFGRSPACVRPIQFNIQEAGYTIVVVKSGGDHAGLTPHYAAIPAEMRQVAEYFGKSVLRNVEYAEFISSLSELRGKVSDRALLRAFHYFDENHRVTDAVSAATSGDVETFVDLLGKSGDSSWMLLQNVSAQTDQQPLAISLTIAKRLLGEKGAARVHGGGFAGTILCLVPNDRADYFIDNMNRALGIRACDALDVRPAGACEIPL